MKLTNEQVGGVVRAIVAVGIGYLAGKNIIAPGMVAELTAAVTAAVIAGWSAYTNRPNK